MGVGSEGTQLVCTAEPTVFHAGEARPGQLSVPLLGDHARLSQDSNKPPTVMHQDHDRRSEGGYN